MPPRTRLESKFSAGDTVMSRWPGSKLFYPAKIVKFKDSLYEVEFDDGTKHKVPRSDIKEGKETTTRKSASRTRTRSRSRSPATTSNSTTKKSKSPPRSPARSRPRTRSSSRERTVPQKKQTTPTKSILKSEKTSPPSSVRKSPRVRVSRVSLDDLYDSDAEDADVGNHKRMETRNRRSLAFKSYAESQTDKTTEIAALQTAQIIGVMAPGMIDVTDSKNVKKTDKKAQKNQHSKHFGGVFGTFMLTLSLPIFILYVNLVCSKNNFNLKMARIPTRLDVYFDLTAIYIYFGWLLFQAVLYTLPLGRLVKGQPLRDGTRLQYRMNGFCAFILSVIAVGLVIYYYNPVNLICSKYNQIIFTSIVFSFVFSIVLYIKSFWCPVYALSTYGNSGNFLYDFFMGRELNPTFLGFDMKMFFELRPGLIGWVALNICLLWKDFMDHGSVSPNLALSAFFQILYVADALFFEEAVISTMDITTEGFGFMLLFGDMAFVPVIFTIQSRFLLQKHLNWNWYCLLPIGVLALVGYVIFRLTNNQKDEFRRNPHGAAVSHLKTISTGLPKKILAGGWWGWVRHPNYFGDLLLAIALCLPCGFDYIIPYAYFLYLFPMLCHRAIRDDAFCSQKYGKSWQSYQNLVPSRIFPKIF